MKLGLKISREDRGVHVVFLVGRDEAYQDFSTDWRKGTERERARRKVAAYIKRRSIDLEATGGDDGFEDQWHELEKVLADSMSPPAEQAAAEQMSPVELRDQASELALRAVPDDVRARAEQMLASPTLFEDMAADIHKLGVEGDEKLVRLVILIAVSRLLPKPLGATVQGASSTGKSYVAEVVASTIPRCEKVAATAMTANALYYCAVDALVHKIVFAGEKRKATDDEASDATLPLREMLSSGKLSKLVTVSGSGQVSQSVLVERDGPIAHVDSTTSEQFFCEDENRRLLIDSDSSADQTARVVMAIADQAEETGTRAGSEIRATHQALHLILRRVRVAIPRPVARALAKAVPVSRPEARRAINQMFSLLKASAVLHQRQRADGPLEHGSEIAVSIEDYVIARPLLIGPMERSLGGQLPDHVRASHELLYAAFGGKEFGVPDVTARKLGLSPMTARRHLKKLRDEGRAEERPDPDHTRRQRWILEEPGDSAASWLPLPADLGEVFSEGLRTPPGDGAQDLNRRPETGCEHHAEWCEDVTGVTRDTSAPPRTTARGAHNPIASGDLCAAHRAEGDTEGPLKTHNPPPEGEVDLGAADWDVEVPDEFAEEGAGG